MKKVLLILFTFFSIQLFAQESDPNIDDFSKVNMPAIEALKIAFITKELNLTQEEAQQFWPTYNSFITEIKQAKQDNKADFIAFEEKKVSILKKYKDDFKKVLKDDNRVTRCFKAEPAFHNLLRKEWRRRIEMRRQNGGPMPRGDKPNNGPNFQGGGPKPNHPIHPPQQPRPHQ